MRFPGLNFKFLYDTTLIPRGRSKIVRCVCLFTRVYFWRQIQMGLATYKSKDSNQHGLNIFLSLKIKKSHRIVDNIICLLSISKRKENNLKTEFY